ncbi:MAG: ComF family protein [Chloroflexota bacterium]|nr:ComF family protein [Chloroflexota bacterium]
MRLLDLVLPPSCAGCGRFGALLCAVCRDSFRPPVDADDRFLAPDAGVVVGDACELAVAAFAYEGALRRALQRLKYGHVARLARPLAEAAAPTLVGFLASVDAMVLAPVPLHAARRRERGYNQAALLADELGHLARMPVHDLLERRKQTTRQHKLDRAARVRNLAGAFGVRAESQVPPSVLVVDDILTTSATLETCAAALRDAGARSVYGFALAREV